MGVNILEALADVVEGKIFEGEPVEPVKAAIDGTATTEATRATPREQVETKAKRKPSDSLADAFKPNGKPVTVATPLASTEVATLASGEGGEAGDDTSGA